MKKCAAMRDTVVRTALACTPYAIALFVTHFTLDARAIASPGSSSSVSPFAVPKLAPHPDLVLSPALGKVSAGAQALNRDEIEYENRVRFFRQATLAAKQEKLKKEAALLEAEAAWKRGEILHKKNVLTESDYRDRRYARDTLQAEVEEQKHLIVQLAMDAEVAELYRRFAAGELEDLIAIADYHVRRWENIVELNKATLKKAQAYKDWSEWSHAVISRLVRSGASTQESLDEWTKHVAMSKADHDITVERIREAELSVAEAKVTLARARRQAPQEKPAEPQQNP